MMLGIGVGLFAVGTIIWRIPHLKNKKFDLRTSDALELRKAGEKDKAPQLETGANLLFQRTSIVGGLIFMTGLIMIIVGVWKAI